MIHPKTQEVISYPNTAGKRVAMHWYNWNTLTRVEEVFAADDILRLAKLIDKEIRLG